MPRPVFAYPDGVEVARISPWDVVSLLGLASDEAAEPEVLLGWMPSAPEWIEDPRLRGTTILGGYGVAKAIVAGRLRYLPVRLGSLPRLITDVIRPSVTVVAGVARGTGYAYRGTVGWGPAAVAAADTVVIEVDSTAHDLGGPMIAAADPVVCTLDPKYAVPALASRDLDEVDLAVGQNVVSVLPDFATIQLGPGGIAEAIVSSIDRPVGIRSGLITESMAELAERDLLRGQALAGYVWGGPAIARLADDGRLALHPVEITHDIQLLAATPGMVTCNTALQVGLDGSVNIERVGGRLVAGIGGHADFCAGAARSAGGLSIIAVRSVTRKGISTIVNQVEVVSTPRCDVDMVITEHGVADLRGLDDVERARQIVTVAAPEHRDGLRI